MKLISSELKNLIIKYNEACENYEGQEETDTAIEKKLDEQEQYIVQTETDLASRIKSSKTTKELEQETAAAEAEATRVAEEEAAAAKLAEEAAAAEAEAARVAEEEAAAAKLAEETAAAEAEATRVAEEEAAASVQTQKEDNSVGWLIFGGIALVATLGLVNVFKKK